MCLNGGALHLCDHCPRAVCHQCLPPLPDVDVSNLDFLCLACHEVIFKRSHLPYYVSPIVLYYLSDSLPLLAGLLCEADVRSQWKTGTFSLETWHRSPRTVWPQQGRGVKRRDAVSRLTYTT